MSTIDPSGAIHDAKGRFAGHVAGESSVALEAPTEQYTGDLDDLDALLAYLGEGREQEQAPPEPAAEPEPAPIEFAVGTPEFKQLEADRDALRQWGEAYANSPDGQTADSLELDDHARVLRDRERSMFPPAQLPTKSPWGAVQQAYQESPGIVGVHTAGHGGYKLSPERNAQVPAALRRRSGWYEEDCEAAIVTMTFPNETSRYKNVEQWRQSGARDVRDWFPDEFEKATGQTIKHGESRGRDEQTWNEHLSGNGLGEIMSPSTPDPDHPGYSTARVKVPGAGVRTYRIPDEEAAKAAAFVGTPTWGAYRPWYPPVSLAGGVDVTEPKPVEPVKPRVAGFDESKVAASKRATSDLDKRWRAHSGEVRTLREIGEQGFTGKGSMVDGSSIKHYLYVDENAYPVSKQTFEAANAPDERKPYTEALQRYQIADAKYQDAQDTSWSRIGARSQTQELAQAAREAHKEYERQLAEYERRVGQQPDEQRSA